MKIAMKVQKQRTNKRTVYLVRFRLSLATGQVNLRIKPANCPNQNNDVKRLNFESVIFRRSFQGIILKSVNVLINIFISATREPTRLHVTCLRLDGKSLPSLLYCSDLKQFQMVAFLRQTSCEIIDFLSPENVNFLRTFTFEDLTALIV
jgi:hypothetical protein